MGCPGGSIPSASTNSPPRASPSPLVQGTGEHWSGAAAFAGAGHGPKTCFTLSLSTAPQGFAWHIATGVPRGCSPPPAAPLSPRSPAKRLSPHPATAQSLRVGMSQLRQRLPGVGGGQAPSPGGGSILPRGNATGARRRTRTRTRRMLTELSYFRLLLFVVVSTVIQSRDIYIYIIYILLKLHN